MFYLLIVHDRHVDDEYLLYRNVDQAILKATELWEQCLEEYGNLANDPQLDNGELHISASECTLQKGFAS